MINIYVPLVITKYNEYYIDNAQSNYNIIETYNLDKNDLITVNLISPEKESDVADITKWIFQVTQTEYPSWTYENDPFLEERARKIFSKIIENKKIGYELIRGNYQNVNVGMCGIAITGDDGKATSENHGTSFAGYAGKAISGDFGMATAGGIGIAYSGKYGTSTVGDYGEAVVENFGIATSGIKGTSIAIKSGNAISGDFGKSIAGLSGKAITGCYGTAFACKYGTAVVEKDGTAIVGVMGKAKAGENGSISIQYFDENTDRLRIITAYIGEDGIEPDTFYKVEFGKLVKVEDEK